MKENEEVLKAYLGGTDAELA
ncbi:MAG: hypothetical protein ACFFER_06650 [Candidatus Thorarchaeota archaeon]